MKKSLIILLLIAITITGCSFSEKSLTCTKTETDEEGYNTTNTIIITYKNNQVIKIKNTSISEVDPNYIDFSYTIGTSFAETLNKANGINVEYSKQDTNKIQTIIEINYSEISEENLKETLGDLYSNDSDSLYTLKNLSIEDFKEKHLDGYTCK